MNSIAASGAQPKLIDMNEPWRSGNAVGQKRRMAKPAKICSDRQSKRLRSASVSLHR
jgi:hypothetical protein